MATVPIWQNDMFGCFNDCSTCKSFNQPVVAITFLRMIALYCTLLQLKVAIIIIHVAKICEIFNCLITTISGILVFCFPAYVFGMNATLVGEDRTACCCVVSCILCPLHCLAARAYVRGKIREKQGIRVSHFKFIIIFPQAYQ